MKLQISTKWITRVIIAVFCICISPYAQTNLNSIYNTESSNEALIDTSDFFPLQDGNYWDFVFSDFSGTQYMSWEVIGDTTMNNGRIYKYILQRTNYSSEYEYYLRKDSNITYAYYGDSIACPERDYKYLDLSLPDSTAWYVCRDLVGIGNARGIAATYFDYTYWTFFQKPLETKRFEDVYIDSTDTLWTPGEGSIPMWFAKGIGPVRIFIFQGGDYWLTGAIIDGQQFGTLVSVDDSPNLIPSSFQISAYPNPFNSTVNFNFTLATSGITDISLYNILGEKVSTILSDYKNSGSYSISYNADYLTSGIYLALLTQGSNSSIQKIILLK